MFNKRFSKKILLGLSASMLIVACQAPTINQNTLAQNSQEQSGITINNDKEKLQDRVVKKDEAVTVNSSGFTTQQVNPLQLQLVAEVAPPNIKGTTVQATNVFIENNLAYVSYDIAGDGFSGGAYIIDISDPSNPQLVSEMTSDTADFYSLTKANNQLYLSGASTLQSLVSPALLQVMELDATGSTFASVKGQVDLPSYAATDVSVLNDSAYVTTGDKGGGLVKVNTQTLSQTGFYPLEDARSVSVDYQNNSTAQVVAFKGTSGELHVLNQDLSLAKKIELAGSATIPVSKSTVEVDGNLAVVGAGDGGMLAVDLSTGQTQGQIKSAGEGITNGASIDGQYIFMAEGFDGVGVAQRSANGEVQRLGSLAFKNDASANMVAYQNNVLFVANGKGGLRILTVNKELPPTDPCYGNAQNWVVNGGFEAPVITPNNYQFVNDLGCWKIGAPGKAELDPVSIWNPAEGIQSLDLNPDQPGEIYQDIYTQPGQNYSLSFAMAGNINALGVKTLEVFWGDTSLGQFSIDNTGKSKTNMGWKTMTAEIPGSMTLAKQTRLRFKSTTPGTSIGPVIDNVIVK